VARGFNPWLPNFKLGMRRSLRPKHFIPIDLAFKIKIKTTQPFFNLKAKTLEEGNKSKKARTLPR